MKLVIHIPNDRVDEYRIFAGKGIDYFPKDITILDTFRLTVKIKAHSENQKKLLEKIARDKCYCRIET